MAAPQFPSETASQDPEMSRTLLEAGMEHRQGEEPPQGGRWRLLRSAGFMGLLLAAGALFVMLSSGAQPLTSKLSSAEQATYGKVSEITQLHGAQCAPSQGPCGTGNACVDITRNNKNCGRCGRECGQGQQCEGGFCKCPTPGLTACTLDAGHPTTCVDLHCDDSHCGRCHTRCSTNKGEKCVEGHCQCMDPTPNACLNGTTLDACVNFLTDDNNCGRCGRTCAVDKGQKCRGGYCECLDTNGTSKISFCGNECVDVLTDKRNCGACGTQCPLSTECVSGTCQCDLGSGLCSGSTTCVDFQNSDQHCGRCSNQCSNGEKCIKGHCQCQSPKSNACMVNGIKTCVNFNENNDHCGRCDYKCPTGMSCDDGTCKCPEPKTFCGKLAGDKCTDLSSDPANCGTCGNRCGAAQTCAAGSCQCPLGMRLCSGVCVDFENDRKNCGFCGNTCPKAQKCQKGYCQCINDGANDEDITGLDACGVPAGAICVNRQNDLKNCGVCNNRCPAAQVCKDGYCQCVDPQQKLIHACGTPLGTLCVDFQTNNSHCGGCDNQCSDGQSCVQGVCKCTHVMNKDACGTVLGGFTCVSLETDRDNCGKCGRRCPADQFCQDGLCKCKSGQAEQHLCSGKCVNFLTDNSNCGGCGRKCSSQKVCNNGNCECVDTVGNETHACGDDRNGYVCVDFMKNHKHCGSCTNECPTAMDCVDGSCQCTGELPDACGPLCVDLSKDAYNCGSCGNLCATGQPCINGVCQVEATCGLDQCVCNSATPCVAGRSVVADGDFGTCTLEGTHKSAGYTYTCPSSQSWTCSGGVVCILSGSTPWGSPHAIDDSDYLLGIQGQGANITQTVNVVRGISYNLTVFAARRSHDASGDVTLKIIVGNTLVGTTVQNTVKEFPQLAQLPVRQLSIPFVAGASTATIQFLNDSPSSKDLTVFLSNVAVTPNQVPVADWDFSGCSAFLPSGLTPGYNYTCPSSSWSCSTIVVGTKGAVCIKSNNSAWGYPQAAGSSQHVVGLQRQGANISQRVDVIPDTSYTLTVYAASRPNAVATLAILVDGVSQCVNTLPPGTSLSTVSCAFTPRTDRVSIAFLNQSPEGDRTVFLSNVIITTTVPCNPGLTRCGGLWVDLASDSKNCGGCGNACLDSGTCTSSACQASQ